MKAYLHAVQREKQAWQALGGRLPGLPGHSAALWAEWLAAEAHLSAELARYTRTQDGGAVRAPQQPRGLHRT